MDGDVYPLQSFGLAGIRWYAARSRAEAVKNWISCNLVHALSDEARLLKNRDGSRVASVEGMVIKESVPVAGEILRFALRPSRARRSFSVGNSLLRHELPTPMPIAWGIVRHYRLRVCDYLITDAIENAKRLSVILKTGCEDSERRWIVREWAKTLALFHGAGFSNRDMKDANILITDDPEKRLWVVDLDGVRGPRRVTRRRSLRDMWAIVRSMLAYGWNEVSDMGNLLEGYNESAPSYLKIYDLPRDGAGEIAREEA